MRARKLIKTAVAELKASEAIDHWQKGRERIEAEDLLAFVMGGDEPDPDDRIGDAERDAFLRLVARRATGEPLPYGIAPNRRVLDELVGHAAKQGIISKPVAVDELFAPSTRGLTG